MKKFLLIAISTVSLFAGKAQAQSFITEGDTVSVTFQGSEVDPSNKIKASANTTINWKVVSTTFPMAWTAVCSTSCSVGICDNHNCYNNRTTYALFGSSPVTTTSDTYTAGNWGDFHLQLTSSLPAVPAGIYYLTINLASPTMNKNIVYAVNYFPTGVGNVSRTDDVELYPNPARGTLNISYDPASNLRTISVYNLIGKTVSSYHVAGNSGNTVIDISDVPSGVYFVRLLDAQNRVLATRKFTHQ